MIESVQAEETHDDVMIEITRLIALEWGESKSNMGVRNFNL
jgi:hypothetical protein